MKRLIAGRQSKADKRLIAGRQSKADKRLTGLSVSTTRCFAERTAVG